MKTITLEVDDMTGMGYQELNPENLKRFKDEATVMLKKMITESRSVKMKKIVEDIKKGYISTDDINPDLLVELLRTEI